jgi:hypothetical protein
MKNRKITTWVFGASSLLIVCVAVARLVDGTLSLTATTEAKESNTTAKKEEPVQDEKKLKTGPMNVGRFFGQVTYDQEKGFYFLELRGVRFPFKSSPIEAQDVLLEAPGKKDVEKNTKLLYGILGKEVSYATVLINPDEEDKVVPAATDVQRYIQIANRKKFGGIAYTKPGGKLKRSSVRKGSQIQALKDATSKTPIILLKGPGSGAKKTRVSVVGDGKVVVEGKTYEELTRAADRICITLIKMLCGSSDCPDAAACATGGKCGCG